MIPREAKRLLLMTCMLCLVQSQGERAYDTSEWIPITPHPLQSSGSEVVERQAPNDRVLTLDSPAKNFFPDYEYRQRQPNQIQQLAPKRLIDPRPRKMKFASEYNFETPPPPPPPQKPHINYYDQESPYLFNQAPRIKQQRPVAERYVAVPSVNPQAPKPDAPNLYEQYQLPFNSSFYHSLSPSSINNDFYQAIRTNGGEAGLNNVSLGHQTPHSQVEQETVQLVYVPVESLNQQSPQTEGTLRERFSLPAYSPVVSQYEPTYKPPQQDQDRTLYAPQQTLAATPESKQSRLESIRQDYLQQSLGAERLQEQLTDDINPLKQSYVSTTAKPGRKAHQPPLAVFLESQQKAEIVDVLNILRGAKTIAVQDKVTPESPQIFIGPSNLDSPDGYTKFPLPYLNNINGNRIERKIDQLPFFVAPVGYKTPVGYAKIALPSPHVGSVVVSVPTPPNSAPPNQLHPFSFSAPEYELPRTEQSIPDSYDLLNPGGGEYQSNLDSFRGQYQSTLNSVRGQYQSTQSPPERNGFGSSFTPTAYYALQPQNVNQKPYSNTVPSAYSQEQPPVTQKPLYSTIRPKQTSQLPEVNNIDLAINEFELSQINNDFEEHNKVKHSTTRRPPAEDVPSRATSSRRPPTRSRFESESTTASGRIRTRGRGGSSRTTSTTTPAPVQPDRYTVLEEFAARDVSTETYRAPSTTAVPTESPRRSTTPFSGSRYLPEDVFDTTRSQSYDNTRIAYESARVAEQQQQQEEGFEPPPAVQQPKPYYTEIENNPANVYSLGQTDTYEGGDFAPSRRPASSTRPVYENLEQSTPANEQNPSRTELAETLTHRFRPEVISYENREPNQGRQNFGKIRNEPKPEVYQVEGGQREPVAEQRPQEGVNEPSGFIDNLFQPNFDQTYISLQDQAVRSLLVPNLLAPSGKQHSPATSSFPRENTVSATEAAIELPSSTEAATTTSTTTAKPTVRTRGRGRARPTSAPVVETAPTRRAPSRRRPITPRPSSTERAAILSTEYASRDDSRSSGSNDQQRFRARTRPPQSDFEERTTTTETYKEPTPEVPYEPIKSRISITATPSTPQIEEQLIITIAPNQEHEIRDYNRVYSVPAPQTTTERQPVVLEYENTRLRTTPIVEAPIVEQHERHLEVAPRQSEEESYRRYNNGNIKSGGVLNNRREPSTSTAAPTRARGRTRGRSRFATTTTTPRPITRVSSRPTSVTLRTSTQEQEEPEFFGFTRQPNYSPAATRISASTTLEPAVRFVGEIRPKYTPRTTTVQPSEDVDYPETPRTRVRTRARPSARPSPANNLRHADNDSGGGRSSEQVTRRTATPQRTRGRSHYRAPDNVKRENDEDVANQNYPTEFLQKLEVSSAKPRKTFQITIDPLETEDDQVSHSSNYRPKFVQAPNDPNGLQFSEKSHDALDASEPQALAFESTSASVPDPEESQEGSTTFPEPVEEPVTKVKKRGAWKLVRHRPADPLEVSESQNYQSVLNAFGSIEKTDSSSKFQHLNAPDNLQSIQQEDEEAVGTEAKVDEIITTTPKTSETQENIFDTLYEMFGVLKKAEENATSSEEASTLTNPVFPEEITDVPATTSAEGQKAVETTESAAASTTPNITISTQPYEVEPWEMKQVKTSTSTEVSHETEICYKGRCVKSRDKKTHK